MRIIRLCILALVRFGWLPLLLGGCVIPARPEQMTVQQPAVPVPVQLAGQVALKTVTGGRTTNPLAFSEVSNAGFHDALEQSLRQSGLLSVAPDTAPMEMSAGLIGMQKPNQGFQLNVLTEVRYVLKDKADGKTRFDEVIAASCTRGVQDTRWGPTRLRLTEECAVRNNIDSFLRKLAALDLG